MTLRSVLAAIAVVLAPFACSSGSDAPPSPASGCKPDIDTIQKTVFAPRCTTSGCHGTTRPLSPLDLESPGVEARLVGRAGSDCATETLVVPGDPAASFLVRKLKDEKPSCGARMPRGEAPLAADDVACIETWIAGLAKGGADAGTSCVDLTSDPKNCGACGKVCPADAKICNASTCVASCPGGSTECGGACVAPVSSFKSEIEQAILVPTCATAQCHGRATAPAGNLDLRAGRSYAQLVGVKVDAAACGSRTRVVPGDVAASYLVDKLKGAPGICGSQMPKTGGLTPAQLSAIQSWICSGAPND